MRKVVGLYLLIVVAGCLGVSGADAQWTGNDSGMCPNGTWVPSGPYGGMMCAPNQPQSICPPATTYCASVSQCCNPGFKCASGGCIAAAADDCGNGQYCNPGQKCRTNQQGALVCISAHEAKVHDILNSLGKAIHDWVPNQVEKRHQKGLEYVLDNEEVRAGVRDYLLSKGLTGVTNEYVSHLLLLSKSSIQNVEEFKQGHYYEGLLHMTNLVSSELLTAIVPWGGTAADALNIAGAVTTAYAYGFFWGM